MLYPKDLSLIEMLMLADRSALEGLVNAHPEGRRSTIKFVEVELDRRDGKATETDVLNAVLEIDPQSVPINKLYFYQYIDETAKNRIIKKKVLKELGELSTESLDRLITFLQLELDMRAGKATFEDQLRVIETIPGREAVLLAELLNAVRES